MMKMNTVTYTDIARCREPTGYVFQHREMFRNISIHWSGTCHVICLLVFHTHRACVCALKRVLTPGRAGERVKEAA